MTDEDYKTLELEEGASLNEIKAAYRDLVAVWHPDNFGHSPRLQAKAEEKMKKINLAYERLCGLKPANQESQSSEAQQTEQSIVKCKETKPTNQNPFFTRPVSKWVGERFIFLPKTKDFQKYGYMSVHKTKDRLGDDLPYRDYVKRIAKVTKVKRSDLNVDYELFDVELVLEDTVRKVYAEASSGIIEDMALVADIENARSLYVGKTLWTEETPHTYNEKTGEETYLETPLGIFPVKVIDVVAGWDTEKPVRFIVRLPSGKEGYIDVHMSDTNISESLRQYDRFEDVFHMEYHDR